MLASAEVLFGVPGESVAGLEDVLERCQSLRWIQATNAGTGQQIRESTLRPEILDEVAVTTASGVYATSLVEFSLMGILHFAKEVPRLSRFKQEQVWERLHSRELYGMNLLIVGLGSICAEVARIGQSFGMRITGVKRHPETTDHHVDAVYSPERLAEVLPEADAVVVTLPLTSDTENLISSEAIKALQPGAIFVNVCRGGVVDEEALTESLETGSIAGAALDVFRQEPLPSDSRLWDLSNVLVSPHSAAASELENERIVELFIRNLGRYLSGKSLENRLYPNQLY